MKRVGPQVLDEPRRVVHADLADEDAVAVVAVGDAPPRPMDLVNLRPVPMGMLAGRHRRPGEVLRIEVREARPP